MSSPSATATTDSGVVSQLAERNRGYDVYLSFRGQDTRKTFTSHLYASLVRAEINVFKDDLRIGSSHQILEFIEKCRVSIIIFSENYASSKWCLEELVKIMECRQRKKQLVLPVYYGVSPSDVWEGSGSMREMLQRFEKEGSADDVPRWRAALEEAVNLAGYVLEDRPESEVIDKIVRNICKALPQSDSGYLIGIDSRVKQLLSLLSIQSQDVRCIGIWGMGGIGKTTIARKLFDRISSEYNSWCYLVNVSEMVRTKGLDHLKHDFFSKILEEKGLNVKPSFLKMRLLRKRVLVILDGVNCFRDVEFLVQMLDWFGRGSRIIITSRDRSVLQQCKVSNTNIYEVKALNMEDSLQLFCWYAFRKSHPDEDWRKKSFEFLNFSKGVPLALKILGSSLFGKTMQYWDTMLSRTAQPHENEIQEVLKRSYDGLDENEKNIFLDIACFFRGEHKDNVARLVEGCGFFAHLGITGLLDKCLITILDNRVEMHDLVQVMGQELVRQEACERGNRSRLWNPEDISYVLTSGTGTQAIKGIFLDMYESRLDLSPSAFESMYNLRLLKFYSSKHEKDCKVYLPRGLDCLPDELRLLHWENYPLKSLPQNYCPTNLVELNLPNSHIEKLWKGTKSLEKLKKLRLSYSQHLIKIPKLSKSQNLEHIDLQGCTSLVEVTSSIRYLDKLTFLNLKDCSNLKGLPSTFHLESLEVLNLSGCSELEQFPEAFPNVKELYLGGTAIRKIPSSIRHLRKLVKLELENCRQLEKLPTSICKLKYLEALNLSGCSRLGRFPEISKTMKSLQFLDLSKTAIKEIPSSISVFKLSSLVKLVLRNLHMSDFPEDLCSLPSITTLDLSGNDFQIIPTSVRNLSELQILSLSSSKQLISLPELPRSLAYLDVHSCTSLEAMSWNSEQGPMGFIISACLGLNLDAPANMLTNALIRNQPIEKQESQVPLYFSVSFVLPSDV